MSTLIELLQSGLEGRYDVERELGSGGMSTVFLAHDARHERHVAIKLLRPDLASAVGADRFLREIKLTASLNHPHVLPLLDSGEIDGLVYYVMPYVSGGSLRTRLAGRTLPLDEARAVAEQVASALDYAHRAGVVHRDVKPENILFSEGLAVVADFGVARAVSTVDRQTLTRSGFPVGTLGYMSPEQAAGRTDLDERTDVFSLGCVVYEMLVGDTPAGWPGPEDARLGRFLEAPAEHRSKLDALPGRVEQTLTRALALRASDRFESPGAFAHALGEAADGRTPVGEEDLRAILARASELELERTAREDVGTPAPSGSSGTTLTMGAVEQAAAEVGIEPARVREAAREVLRASERGETRPATAESVRHISTAPAPSPAWPRRGPHGGRSRRVPGGPGPWHGPQRFESAPDFAFEKERLTAERTVDGEVAPAGYPELVDAIQEELDLVGHVSTIGRTLTWSPARQGSESRQVVVTVRPREGVTDLHVEEQIEMSGWRVFAPAWGAGAGMLFGVAVAALLGFNEGEILFTAVPGGIFGAFATVRGMINAKARDAGPQLQRVLDRLAGLIEGSR